MPPELIAGILGPIVGAVFGIIGFTSKRNASLTDAQLESIAENVEVIGHQVTNLQIQLPTKYVSKEEMMTHITSEEMFHRDISNQLRELRDEVISLRANRGHH
jgi:chromosome segregation ATPase